MIQTNALSKRRERSNYVDIAKGIVILLVVIGHAVTFQGKAFFVIFSFHMPFFFLISGWCKAYSNKVGTFLPMLGKSVIKLIIPSIIFRALRFWQPDNLKEWAKTIFLNPYSEWFLTTMFVINILFYFFKKYDVKNDNKYYKIGFLVSLIGIVPIFVQIYIYRGYHMKFGIPFSFDCVAIGFSFSIIGYYLHKFMQKNKMPKLSALGYISALIVVGLALKLLYTNSYVNVCDGMMGISDTFFYFCAFLLSMVVIYGSKCMDCFGKSKKPILFLNRLLELYGRNSLWIYLCHILMFDKYGVFLNSNGIELNHYLLVALYTIVTMVILTPVFIILEKFKKAYKSRKSAQG